MEVSFDVKITPGVLYDYLLYHTYTGTTGLLGTIAGALLVAAYFMAGSILYLIFDLPVLPHFLYLQNILGFWCGGACVSSLDIIYPVEEAVSCKSCI